MKSKQDILLSKTYADACFKKQFCEIIRISTTPILKEWGDRNKCELHYAFIRPKRCDKNTLQRFLFRFYPTTTIAFH